MITFQGREQPASPADDEGLLVLDLDTPKDFVPPPDDRGKSLYDAVRASARPRVAVDLGEVDVLSSGDVRVLVNLKRRAEAKRGGVVLLRPRAHVRRLLLATRLSRHFPIADDRPSALALLQSTCPA